MFRNRNVRAPRLPAEAERLVAALHQETVSP